MPQRRSRQVIATQYQQRQSALVMLRQLCVVDSNQTGIWIQPRRRTVVAWRGRTTTRVCPKPAEYALLADMRFVLPPEFDRLATGMVLDRGGDQGGEVFMCLLRGSIVADRARPGWQPIVDAKGRRKPVMPRFAAARRAGFEGVGFCFPGNSPRRHCANG